jgi:serine/threonine-protein kinase
VRTARKVTHPRVCRILEFGVHERSQPSTEAIPFLTMPLLAGETLAAQLARNGPLAPNDALSLLLDLATGLDAVHQASIVHRDFKSENVFLVRNDDGVARAVVMDFGLARALERRAGQLGSANAYLYGTPAYMAPEQVAGGHVTFAADVYAFGVVAYEALTGGVPSRGRLSAATGRAHAGGGVRPPSSLVPGIAKAWDLLIERCMERDPRRRFATMGEIIAALERLRRRAPRRWRRRAAAVAVGGLALAAIATVTTMWRPGRVERGESRPPVSLVTADLAPTPGPVPESPALGDETPKAATPAARRARARRTLANQPVRIAPAAPVAPAAALRDDSVTFEPPVSRERHPDDLVDPF